MTKSVKAAQAEPQPVSPVWPEIYLAFVERTMRPPSFSGGLASAWFWPLQYWSGCAAAWSSACTALADAVAPQSGVARSEALTDEAAAAHILD